MEFTKATEADGTTWSLIDFTVLYGRFSIVKEHTGSACGVFNNRGVLTKVHIEKKVRKTSVTEILNNQSDYEVVVVIDEYCLYKKGDIIAYNVILEDSHPYESDYRNLDLLEYYNENSDVFDGEIIGR